MHYFFTTYSIVWIKEKCFSLLRINVAHHMINILSPPPAANEIQVCNTQLSSNHNFVSTLKIRKRTNFHMWFIFLGALSSNEALKHLQSVPGRSSSFFRKSC